MKRYKFTVTVRGRQFNPKGFYYQGKKYIILVGDEEKNHTIRMKELVTDVEILIEEI